MAKPIRHGKKWKIRWVEGGRRPAKVFERYEDADRALREKKTQRDEIKRGLRAEPAGQLFGDLCDYWIRESVPRKRSGKDDESIIRKHLRPVFGALKLTELTLAPIDAFINARRAVLDPKTVQNHLILLRAMLNVAIELRWIDRVPKMPKVAPHWRSGELHYLEGEADVHRFLNAAAREAELFDRARLLRRQLLRVVRHHRRAQLRE